MTRSSPGPANWNVLRAIRIPPLDVNDIAHLGHWVPVRLAIDGICHDARAHPIIRFVPTPRVEIALSATFDVLKALTTVEKKVAIHYGSEKINVLWSIRTGMAEPDRVHVRAIPQRLPVDIHHAHGPDARVHCASFWLFNLIRAHGVEPIELEAEGWEIRIDPAQHLIGKDRRSIRQDIEREGGFMFTHWGNISKCGDEAATVDEIKDVLEGLGWGLSFAIGRWCHPVAPVALSPQGDPVWEQWSVPQQPWMGRVHAPSEGEKARIEELCKAFLTEWRQAPCRRHLRDIVDYYI